MNPDIDLLIEEQRERDQAALEAEMDEQMGAEI